MAIEHTTIVKGTGFQNWQQMQSWCNSILSAYDWEEGSEVTGNSLDTIQGKFYFTANSYIKISARGGGYKISITLVTPVGTREMYYSNSQYTMLAIGKTAKGICINMLMATTSTISARSPYFYNLYVGEITLADGTTTKGCIYVADDNSHIIATDEGISSEATFASTINSARKGYLIPVTDSTFGGVFKDVYLMACAPVQYNKFKIADTDKKYLCGKAFCLED